MSSASSTSLSVASPPASTQVASLQDALRRLRVFIGTAPSTFGPAESVKSFELPADFGTVSCVFWNDIYHITGTDIIKCMLFRVRAMNCVVAHMKKFEEGVFSDLRNLKPGVDSTLEEPKSPFLEFLVSQKCIRTQKKQKVFYWFSVDHDKLFLDAVDRDLKRMKQGQ
ncbi:STE like transcription factor-domain-containing protein, partial [Zopfochytrium polystomum]